MEVSSEIEKNEPNLSGSQQRHPLEVMHKLEHKSNYYTDVIQEKKKSAVTYRVPDIWT